MATIFYTHTDEAPALATASFLPIVQASPPSRGGGCRDPRHLARGTRSGGLPRALTPEQQVGDALAELGGLATLPEANIIKLPNISARSRSSRPPSPSCRPGIRHPGLPRRAETVEEKDVRARYDRIKGSAVNPVLREGNSDRRAPVSVKSYARKHPHRTPRGADRRPGSRRSATTTSSNEKSVLIAGRRRAHDPARRRRRHRHAAQDRPEGPPRRDHRRDVPLGAALDAFLARRSGGAMPTTCSTRCTSRRR